MIIGARSTISKTKAPKPSRTSAASTKQPKVSRERRRQAGEIKSKLKKLMGEEKKDKSGSRKVSKKAEKDRVKRLERSLRENLKEAVHAEEQARTKAETRASQAEQMKANAQSQRDKAELKAAYSDSQLASAKAQVEQLKAQAENSSTQEAMTQLTQAETALAKANLSHAESVSEKLKAGKVMSSALEFGAKAKKNDGTAREAKSKLTRARHMARQAEKGAGKPPALKDSVQSMLQKLGRTPQAPDATSQNAAEQMSRQTVMTQGKMGALNSQWIQGALQGPVLPAARSGHEQGKHRAQRAAHRVNPTRGGANPGVRKSLLRSTPLITNGPGNPHQTDAEALMHRARALRQEGKFEEAKQAESRARTAVFRSELNTITAQGAEQKRQNALIAGLGVAPEGLAEDQKREVLAQFQNLESGLPSVALAGRSNQKLEKEADRAYATPPKRWEDPSWIPADERKRRRSGVPHKSLTPS